MIVEAKVVMVYGKQVMDVVGFELEVVLVMCLACLHVMHFLSSSPICSSCEHLQHPQVQRLVTRMYTNEVPG